MINFDFISCATIEISYLSTSRQFVRLCAPTRPKAPRLGSQTVRRKICQRALFPRENLKNLRSDGEHDSIGCTY